MLEDVTVEVSEGVRDGHDARGEAIAAIALRSEGLLAPQDESPQLAVCVIIRRFDTFVVGEGPKGERADPRRWGVSTP